MTALDLEDDVELEPTGPPAAAAGEPWLQDKNGKDYVPRRGRQGIISRQGSETVEQARERDSKPKPPRPKRTKRPKLAAPPSSIDLKLIEKELEQAIKAPAALLSSFGEEWPAQHINACAPGVARNFVLAAEHNPWLRRQLEEIATGSTAIGYALSITQLTGSLILLLVPIGIYYGLPLPNGARVMFGVPYRNHPVQDAPAPPPQPAESADTAPYADAA